MTTAGWRVERTNHAGEKLAPMDYTDKQSAQQHINRLTAAGCYSELWQWDHFTGRWLPHQTGDTP
jgi:hypothetical protein